MDVSFDTFAPCISHPPLSFSSKPRLLRLDPIVKLLHCRFEGLFIGAYNLADLLAVLKEQEGRHGAHAELVSHVWDIVDVELVEAC